MRTELRWLVRTSAAALILTLTACLDPVDPSDARVAAVRVTFDGANTSDTIQVRGTTIARAAALAQRGYDLGRADFTFTSSNESVAVVEPTGVVRAIGPGKATIRAALPDGTAGEGEVVVIPSTVAYTIPVGASPGAMAFSRDYTRLYVTMGTDSLAIVDALGYFRLSALRLGLPGDNVAATATTVYVTHSASDSVSIISTATNAVTRRISLGDRPAGIAATADRAFLAVTGERRIVILEGENQVGTIALAGEPHEVAVARDGRRLFVSVDAGSGGWRIAIAAPATGDTLGTVAVSSAPGAIATDLSGRRLYVLLPTENRVAVFAEGADGRYASVGSVAVGAGATGISARLVDPPTVVVSGEPITVFDGATLVVSERIPNVGTGRVAVRPDGVFAFISAIGSAVVQVLGL